MAARKRAAASVRAKAKPAAKKKVAAKAAAAPKRKPVTKTTARPKPKPKPARPAALAKRARKAAPRQEPAARKASPRKPALARASTRSHKSRILADLRKGLAAVLDAARALASDAADAPLAPGKWSPRELVLHLAFWDEWLIGAVGPAHLRDERPEPVSGERTDLLNARAIEAGQDLDWDSAQRLFADSRAKLLSVLEHIPADAQGGWARTSALGEITDGYADHDRHHAAQLRAVAKRDFAPTFAAQRSGANAKDLLLFELQRARVAVHAALQGVSGGLADRAVREGGWTVREVVLHLIARDKVRLEEFEHTLAGRSASWVGIDAAQLASINEWHLGELRHLSWDDALRLLQTKRAELVTALLAVPAEPAHVWSPEHPFGRMLHGLPGHDRHHAAQIKRVRIEGS